MSRLLVCGARDWTDESLLRWVLAKLVKRLDPEVVIHGAARGADHSAGTFAEFIGIPVETYPADWFQHGKKAGPRRNQLMLTDGKPTHAVGFTDDYRVGRGTYDMLERCRRVPLQGVYLVQHAGERAVFVNLLSGEEKDL